MTFEKVDGWNKAESGNLWLPYEQVPEEIRKHLPKRGDVALPFRGMFYTTRDKNNDGKITVFKSTAKEFENRRKYYTGDNMLADPEKPAPAPTPSGGGGGGAMLKKAVKFDYVKLPAQMDNDADKAVFIAYIEGKIAEEGWEPWGLVADTAIKDGYLWLVKREGSQ